jgi:hypothetical protein
VVRIRRGISSFSKTTAARFIEGRRRYHLMLSLRSVEGKGRPISTVYAVEGANGNDGSLNRLLELMDGDGLKFYKSKAIGTLQGTRGLIAAEDVIIVKVNSQWDECGMTNTDLVKAIVYALLAHPDGFRGEVVVADNGQGQYGSTGHGGSFDYAVNNSEDRSQSIRNVAESFGGLGKVSAYLWDTITENEVKEYSEGNDEDGFVLAEKADPLTGMLPSYPKFQTTHGSFISFKRGVWDPETKKYDNKRLKMINVPVLKSHFIFGVTGAVKHYMGVPSDKLSAAKGYRSHPSVGLGGMGTLMAETRVPTLNIIDAIHVNAKPGTGPKTPFDVATYAGIIAAGTDPFALDYWASKNILCPLAKAKYKADVSLFDPDNEAKGCFGDWLKLAARKLNDAGHLYTHDEARIAVKVAGKN